MATQHRIVIHFCIHPLRFCHKICATTFVLDYLLPNTNMKRQLLLLAILAINTCLCQAQYYRNYNPYEVAVITEDVKETRMLNNIRFNEEALKSNAEAWNRYQAYQNEIATYQKESRTYEIITYSGLGIACASLVPMMMGGNSISSARSAMYWGTGLLTLGGLTTLVGYVGMSIQSDRIKTSKKELIYYLKASHNGIGIVTIF